jgi:hypothetical protein
MALVTSLEEARDLYRRIPTMTVREMREVGRTLRIEWLSSASKRQIQAGLSQAVARRIVELEDGGAQ